MEKQQKKIQEGFDIITFGCRLNIYESEVMRRHAEAAGIEDAVIINTCAVTGEAERQAKQAIRKIRRERPNARIIVTGCAAQIDPEQFAAMPEVDHVISNNAKMMAQTFVSLRQNRPVPPETDSETKRVFPVRGFEGKSRAFVQVQNGCDHHCTFCIIPYGRGPSRSVPVKAIIEQVKTLAENSYCEMTFTGVDIASYGRDLPQKITLGAMIKQVLEAVPKLTRLRLSSLDPAAFDDDLWSLIANEPRLMPHLHLSLQSGDELILKRMKRRHTPQDVLKLCEKARKLRPDIAFGADVIAGFPTETDDMHSNTVKLVKECGIAFLHVFPDSARKGTPAARMPQVAIEKRRERAAELRALGEENLRKHLDSLVGRQFEILAEKSWLGRTPCFAEARLLEPAAVGDVVKVKGVRREGLQVLVKAVE